MGQLICLRHTKQKLCWTSILDCFIFKTTKEQVHVAINRHKHQVQGYLVDVFVTFLVKELETSK